MDPLTARRDGASVIVVDDNPDNLKVLAGILKERGYRARPVLSGRMALQAAAQAIPDLILLDITMPEMDGYEVCLQLKADPRLASIPVIFISALDDTEGKVKAFGCGGVDYITKPFHAEEVLARVRTHVELCRQRQELRRSYDRLRELEALRDNLIRMIVHDMRSPLTTISLSAAMLTGLGHPALSAKALQCVGMIREASDVLVGTVDSLVDVSRMQAGELRLNPSPCDLAATTRRIVDAQLSGIAGSRVVFEGSTAPALVAADTRVLERVLRTLVDNAIERSPADESIHVCFRTGPDEVSVMIHDRGPGVPADHRPSAFEMYGQASSAGSGRGHATWLDFAFCRLAVEAHGGSIGVDSDGKRGCTFWFALPAHPLDPSAWVVRSETSAPRRTSPVSSAASNGILIVDGDPEGIRHTERLLSEAGYVVLTACSGSEGYAKAVRHSPDAVLLEVNLPDTDGGDLAHRLEMSPETRRIPVVFLTDLLSEADVGDSHMLGRWHCLAKPARREPLLRVLRGILGQR